MDFQALSVYFDTLVKQHNRSFMKSSLQDLVTNEIGPGNEITLDDIKDYFSSHVVSKDSALVVADYDTIVNEIVNGCVVILFDGWDRALSFRAMAVNKRQVEEPATESVVQGPREGTVEDLTTNIGLVRFRVRSSRFKLEYLTAGGDLNTRIAYGYIDGVVDPNTLVEFRRRIATLDVEVLETSYVEQALEEAIWSPFPQFRYTERTDIIAASLLDGKIVVMVQGSSTVLLCPGLFTEFLQSPEDYYQRTVIASLIRVMRWIAFFTALTLPSVYIALTTFHSELIPTVLLLAIIDSREGIPFPAFLEAIIMEFFFELLREAGIRLPKPIGSAVSIVGALVIGEAAINAGIASPIMVVVVALTGIASFALPQYNLASTLRILRFPLMLMAAAIGGFGVMIGLLWIMLHMTTLRSLGQPYLAPLGSLRVKQLRDIVVRAPLDSSSQLETSRSRHMRTGRRPKGSR